MCDYSLHNVASRPAKVGDRLVTTQFVHSLTCGFTAIGEANVAVCLRPGTELAFDEEIRRERPFLLFGKGRTGQKVARFRQINMENPNVHHDALELPDGRVVMVTNLVPNQTAAVLQLPAAGQEQERLKGTAASLAEHL